MKTLEALYKYLASNIIAPNTIIGLTYTFKYLNEMFPDLPSNAGSIDEWTKWLHDDKKQALSTIKSHIKRLILIYHFLNVKYDLPIDFIKKIKKIHPEEPKFRDFGIDGLAKIIMSCKNNEEC